MMRTYVKHLHLVLVVMLVLVVSGTAAAYAEQEASISPDVYQEWLDNKRIAEEQYLRAIEEGDKAVAESESIVLKVPDDLSLDEGGWWKSWLLPTNAYNTKGGSGLGVSNSSASASQGTMKVMARAEGAGSYWANARLWVRFTLDGPSYHYRIYSRHLLKGVLTGFEPVLGLGKGDILIRLRVYDHTNSRWIHDAQLYYNKTHGTSSILVDYTDKTDNQYVYLTSGRNYSIQIWADTTAEGAGGLGHQSEFYSSDRRFGWQYVSINQM